MRARWLIAAKLQPLSPIEHLGWKLKFQDISLKRITFPQKLDLPKDIGNSNIRRKFLLKKIKDLSSLKVLLISVHLISHI